MDFLIEEGFLKVGNIHSIFYQIYGNPDGEPILFIHGGPGAGFSDMDKRFFNFEKHKVIFYDQRGASRSLPFSCIKENTTQHLVDDISVLLGNLRIDRVNIFGGSWGTTLSLIFSIQNPDKVKSLLLRGLFLGNKSAIRHYLNGGIKNKFPEVWNRFIADVPMDKLDQIPIFYLDKMINGTEQEKNHFSYEWAFYEISIYKEKINEGDVHDILKQIPYMSLAIMEAHYYSNNCFIEENFIVKNINQIKDIPITIIHGKNDNICPVHFVFEFHQKLSNSVLYVENAGHSDKENEIEERIIKTINEIY